jgi:uncharacterized MAPEG superfamily protein
MTTDLWCLVANAIWGWVLVNIEAMGKTRAAGTDWNLGNRDTEPDFPASVKRAGRAVANHKENFPFFLTAVIVVHLAGKADGTSATACMVYAVARAAHGLLYVAGITKVRSLAFMIGMISIFVILSRLLVH